MTFSDKRNERICCQQTCTTRNAKGSSLGCREMSQVEILIFRKEWKAPEMVNKCVNIKVSQIQIVIKYLTKKTPSPDGFIGELYQVLKEEIY